MEYFYSLKKKFIPPISPSPPILNRKCASSFSLIFFTYSTFCTYFPLVFHTSFLLSCPPKSLITTINHCCKMPPCSIFCTLPTHGLFKNHFCPICYKWMHALCGKPSESDTAGIADATICWDCCGEVPTRPKQQHRHVKNAYLIPPPNLPPPTTSNKPPALSSSIRPGDIPSIRAASIVNVPETPSPIFHDVSTPCDNLDGNSLTDSFNVERLEESADNLLDLESLKQDDIEDEDRFIVEKNVPEYFDEVTQILNVHCGNVVSDESGWNPVNEMILNLVYCMAGVNVAEKYKTMSGKNVHLALATQAVGVKDTIFLRKEFVDGFFDKIAIFRGTKLTQTTKDWPPGFLNMFELDKNLVTRVTNAPSISC